MTIRTDAARRPDKKAARPVRRGALFRLSESPSHLLRRAEQFAAETFLKAELPDSITLRQTVLLAAIAEAEGASQSNLVSATGVDRSTLAEMMARMEQKGFISRSAAHDDGRAKSVSLTSQGRRRLEGALPAMRAVDKALLDALPANLRAVFKTTLLALAEAADQQHADAVESVRPAKKASPKARAMKSAKARRKR
ncbi:MAG: MarR family transcriptional regulator [Hyphomonadaceae bacterium]|nr:MarR family transcriptional regulator [Hyphomonadaceae bacterium]